jgi:hypothetical protein
MFSQLKDRPWGIPLPPSTMGHCLSKSYRLPLLHHDRGTHASRMCQVHSSLIGVKPELSSSHPSLNLLTSGVRSCHHYPQAIRMRFVRAKLVRLFMLLRTLHHLTLPHDLSRMTIERFTMLQKLCMCMQAVRRGGESFSTPYWMLVACQDLSLFVEANRESLWVCICA